MTSDKQPRVALVWRGDPDFRAKASAQRGRLVPVFEALARDAGAARPASTAGRRNRSTGATDHDVIGLFDASTLSHSHGDRP